jgi:hypothetical protein
VTVTLILPAKIWGEAIGILRRPPHDRERILYLDGPRGTDPGVATTITVPDAFEHEGHFSVDPLQMRRAGRHLRRFGMTRLAQIHTHPADWTGHSPHDDEMAFSQRDGAISVVIPDFAGTVPGILDCGVHIREPRGWRELDYMEKAQTVRIVPSLIDVRG